MKKHLLEQTSSYGPQILVNLVNSKGYEKPVKDAYERHVGQLNLPDVHYEYFDFHKECSKMRWDRISLLFDKIQDNLVKQRYPFVLSCLVPFVYSHFPVISMLTLSLHPLLHCNQGPFEQTAWTTLTEQT